MPETTPDPLPAIRSRSHAIALMTADDKTWFLTELAGRFPDVFDEVRRAVEGVREDGGDAGPPSG
jgi:hypothetical protein